MIPTELSNLSAQRRSLLLQPFLRVLSFGRHRPHPVVSCRNEGYYRGHFRTTRVTRGHRGRVVCYKRFRGVTVGVCREGSQ